MKNLLAILILLFAMQACSDSSSDQEEVTFDSTSVVTDEATPILETDLYVWEIDMNSKTRKKNPLFSSYVPSVDSLIIGLNRKFPEIQMEKVKLSGDTLYTRIPNSTYLTQQFGSSGAEYYMVQSVVNLTAVPGINYVNMDFKPGDHAMPGVFDKKSFDDYKLVE